MTPLLPFTVPLPADLHAWGAQRIALRSAIYTLLGDLPPAFTPPLKVVGHEAHSGFAAQKFTFTNGLGDAVYGYLLLPDQPTGAAVLYCHYHGGRYFLGKGELFTDPGFGGVWEGQTPRGTALARAGYVVLAIDSYAFGEREQHSIGGTRYSGGDAEHALFKQFLWQGRTLWGMMLHDDLLALNLLLSLPQVDPARVAVTGASMGGSRATWLAALDERIKVAAPVVQYTRYQNLLAAGNLNAHGIYYYVPNVLKAGIDMEALTALAAPRPQLVLIGDSDPLSPADGIHAINAYTRAVYALYGAEDRFEPRVEAGLAHVYTPAMFGELLAFFARWL